MWVSDKLIGQYSVCGYEEFPKIIYTPKCLKHPYAHTSKLYYALEAAGPRSVSRLSEDHTLSDANERAVNLEGIAGAQLAKIDFSVEGHSIYGLRIFRV